MAATSVPKARLVSLILDDLKAVAHARADFHVGDAVKLPTRLMTFTKPQLLSFIFELGTGADEASRKVQSAFPLHRPRHSISRW